MSSLRRRSNDDDHDHSCCNHDHDDENDVKKKKNSSSSGGFNYYAIAFLILFVLPTVITLSAEVCHDSLALFKVLIIILHLWSFSRYFLNFLLSYFFRYMITFTLKQQSRERFVKGWSIATLLLPRKS